MEACGPLESRSTTLLRVAGAKEFCAGAGQPPILAFARPRNSACGTGPGCRGASDLRPLRAAPLDPRLLAAPVVERCAVQLRRRVSGWRVSTETERFSLLSHELEPDPANAAVSRHELVDGVDSHQRLAPHALSLIVSSSPSSCACVPQHRPGSSQAAPSVLRWPGGSARAPRRSSPPEAAS